MDSCLTIYRLTQAASHAIRKVKSSQCALFLVGCVVVVSSEVWAHGKASTAEASERMIVFPDIEGGSTLVSDLHMHSVFSDGHVWPRTRVEEALRDGLDAIAITEHLEWQPHLADIPHLDRNRAHAIAEAAAAGQDLIVIKGSEITRDWPVGHINAIFITDANPLLGVNSFADPADTRAVYQAASQYPAASVLETANDQGAFLFWNHPDWVSQRPNGVAVPSDFHIQMIDRGWLHGIEIANGEGYSEEAFSFALANGLTIIGVSDVHDLIDWDYKPHLGGHRPVTLVLAESESPRAMREALFAGHTVVYYKDWLMGRKDQLERLMPALIEVINARYPKSVDVVQLTLANHSDLPLTLELASDMSFLNAADWITVPAQSETVVGLKTGKRMKRVDVDIRVKNALVAPRTPFEMTLSISPRRN